MAIEQTGPCAAFAAVADIPTDSVCRQQASGDGGATTAEIEDLIAEATDIVWVALARPPIGVCTSTIYPCRNGNGWMTEHGVPRHSIIADLTTWHGCPPDLIKLDTPVVDITSVVVNGAALATADYVLHDGRWLARASGAAWPTGSLSDLTAFSITYTHGTTVPPLVTDAVVELVDELWKEKLGVPNVLPPRTRSVNRQGMSVQVEDDAARAAKAGPSLPKLVKAMGVYNPTGERWPSGVFSPDDDFTNHTVRTFP